MNKKGGLMLGVIFMIFIFMIGIWVLPLLEDVATDARNNLNCDTPDSISDGNKFTCIFTGAGIPIYIIIILTLAGGFIGSEL
jgi:lipopolysaccharide export LptBFGC system permease protein LptF